MLGGVDILKPVRMCGQIGEGLLGNVGRVVLQNNPNGRLFRVMLIQSLQQSGQSAKTLKNRVLVPIFNIHIVQLQ